MRQWRKRSFDGAITWIASRSSPGRVVAVVLVAVLGGAFPASADAPETGADPTVTLTVTPSDFLSDGQSVTVTGAGFPANAPGTIRECGGAAAAECDLTVIATFVTSASGNIPPTPVAVERIIDTGTTTFNCGVQSCWLVATAGGKTSQHRIRMAGAGTSVPPPSSSIPPTSAPPTSLPPATSQICVTVRGLLEAFPSLSALFTTLLGLFNCPPLAAGG